MARRRTLIKTRAAIVALALAATACGGGSPSDTLRDVNGNVITDGPAGPPVATTAPRAAPTEVLAFAAENSTSQSYRFEQGASMRMTLGGERLVMSPKTPMLTGVVQGEQTQMSADLGDFVLSGVTSAGIDPLSAEYEQLEQLAEGLTFDVWTNGSVVTMDMSSMVKTMPEFDEVISGTGFLANGPISFDTDAVDGHNMAIANSLGMDSSIIDPVRLADALTQLDGVSASGVDNIDGRKVAAYSGRLSMAQWFEVAGQSLDDANSTWGEIATGDTESSTAMVRAMTVALKDLEVDVVILIDGDALMRRLEVSIDMTPLLEVMFTDPDVMLAMAAESGVTTAELRNAMRSITRDLHMSIDVWQNFSEYGSSFDIVIPEANDVTGNYTNLVDGLAA